MKVRYTLFAFLFFSTQAFALDFTLGIAATNTYLTEWQQTNGQQGSEIASLNGNIAWVPDVGLNGEEHKFGHSNFGYYFFGGYNQGKVNSVVSSQASLPSAIKTSIAYGGGTVFYDFDGREAGSGQHIVGVGLGLGYLTVKGAIPAAFTQTNATENIDLSTLGLAVDVFYRYQKNGWYFYAGAKGVRGNTATRVFQTNATHIAVGKSFDIDWIWNAL